MLFLTQVREELALYFELLSTPKTAAEKAIRDRIVGLHNELANVETRVAVVPVDDLVAAISAMDAASANSAPASFVATVKAVLDLIETRKQAQDKAAEAPVQTITPEVVS